MPIFHQRFEGHTNQGQEVPSAIAWLHIGPRIQVLIGVHSALEKALAAESKPVPVPLPGLALIDTGATKTSIDLGAATKLGLAPTGVIKLGTAGGAQDAPTFAFSFQLPSFPRLDSPQGEGCNLAGQGIIALIGMDLLSRCLFVLNGPDGSFTLVH
jgi:hypothetical protein